MIQGWGQDLPAGATWIQQILLSSMVNVSPQPAGASLPYPFVAAMFYRHDEASADPENPPLPMVRIDDDLQEVDWPPPGDYRVVYYVTEGGSDQIYFLAIPQKNDPLQIVDGNNLVGDNRVLVHTGTRLKVKAKGDCQDGEFCPYINAPVLFEVLAPEAAMPSYFINAKLSKRGTVSVPPFDYPRVNTHLDGNTLLVDELIVYTDTNGEVAVAAVFGNASNFEYRIKASLVNEPSSSVIFSVSTSVNQNSSICWDDWRERDLEYAMIGQEMEAHVTCVSYSVIANDGTSTFYSRSPIPNRAVQWSLLYGSTVEFLGVSLTDQHGTAASPSFTVPDFAPEYEIWAYGDVDFFGGFEWINFKGVPRELVLISGIKRVTESGIAVDLQDGGTVYSTDQAIVVQVYNPLSYYLELKVAESGGDLVISANGELTDKQDENLIHVLPHSGYYIFSMVKGSKTSGQVHFTLKDPSGAVLSNKMVYIEDNCCRSERCPDCDSGRWSGAVGGFTLGGRLEHGPPVLQNTGAPFTFAAAWGELYTLGPAYLTEGIQVICAGIGTNPELNFDVNVSGLFCWGTPCIEDLEGVGVDIGRSRGLLSISFGFGTGTSKCFSWGVSMPIFGEKLEEVFKSKTWVAQGCYLETLSGP